MEGSRRRRADRGGDVGEAVDEGGLAGGGREARQEPRRLHHRPVAHETDAHLAEVPRLSGIVGSHHRVALGAEASQHALDRRRRRGHEAELAVVHPDQVRDASLAAGAEGRLDRLRNHLAVDHRSRVGVALLAHVHEVHAAHHVLGRELAQRRERRRVLAADAGEFREGDADRLTGGLAVGTGRADVCARP